MPRKIRVRRCIAASFSLQSRERKECQFGEYFLQKVFPSLHPEFQVRSLDFALRSFFQLATPPITIVPPSTISCSQTPKSIPFQNSETKVARERMCGVTNAPHRGRLHLWRSKWENNGSKTESIAVSKFLRVCSLSLIWVSFLSPLILWSRATKIGTSRTRNRSARPGSFEPGLGRGYPGGIPISPKSPGIPMGI